MVFFNYSTMQMTAKVVYYGPGLCGKTTNLQYIYTHTAGDSRGEMVSLETESDRTLFFDLLPIDVGSIGGFNTRIQLYTVPGQVFYNTTRKLVLKGVDGVVFVADSQRPMLKANADSLRNLEENLGELGLSLDSMPIVLQYNKRDLPEVVHVEELDRALNSRKWPTFEASAATGLGVFDTLKGISKLTLVNLKKKLTKIEPPGKPAPRPLAGLPVAAAATAPPRPSPPPPRPVAARPGKLDVLAELERIRKQALAPRPAPGGASAAATPGAQEAAALNGKHEITREIQLSLKRADFERAKRFLLTLQVEDGQHQVMEAVRDFQVDIDSAGPHQRVVLRLNIALRTKE